MSDWIEETMLYREPTSDSDPEAVQDIWGEKLETLVVDASRVPELLGQGWATHPGDVGKSPEERADFERVHGTADAAIEALKDDIEGLTAERDTLRAENARLAADLKAAEDLADAETRAKESLQSELNALKAGAASNEGKRGKG